MKKILFPTDFSEAATKAFRYALFMAQRFGCDITTVHVYEGPEVNFTYLPHTLHEMYEAIQLDQFEDYRASIEGLHKIAEEADVSGVNLRHVLVEGDIELEIRKAAISEKATMIVMGTKGAGWLKQIFTGTISAELLENSPCPVLAVPVGAEWQGNINKIVVTTEFAPEEKALLQRVLSLADTFGAQVFCVNVDLAHTSAFDQRMQKFSADFAGRQNLQFKILEGDDLQRRLLHFAEDQKVDMIAMITHKRNFLQELFDFSEAKMLSYESKYPILGIPVASLEKDLI